VYVVGVATNFGSLVIGDWWLVIGGWSMDGKWSNWGRQAVEMQGPYPCGRRIRGIFVFGGTFFWVGESGS
jgi:hypothetical protein